LRSAADARPPIRFVRRGNPALCADARARYRQGIGRDTTRPAARRQVRRHRIRELPVPVDSPRHSAPRRTGRFGEFRLAGPGVMACAYEPAFAMSSSTRFQRGGSSPRWLTLCATRKKLHCRSGSSRTNIQREQTWAEIELYALGQRHTGLSADPSCRFASSKGAGPFPFVEVTSPRWGGLVPATGPALRRCHQIEINRAFRPSSCSFAIFASKALRSLSAISASRAAQPSMKPLR
jgi:hypothetical protein